MTRKATWPALILTLALCGSHARAQAAPDPQKPFLHPLFSENAVLQRDRVVPIWGWTQPGTTVVVALDGRPQTTVAARDGRWTISIPPHAAGGPHALEVTDPKTGESALRRNVLFGDVWLCSGQSNMAYDVRGASNSEQEIAAANYPELRLLRVVGSLPATPEQTFKSGAWQPCTPQSIIDFAGVGYFFGRDLHQQLRVPIGLIDSSASGTVAQAWIGAAALSTIPDFKRDVDALNDAAHPPARITDPNTPTVLFNGKVAPLLPGALKGIIWYQGESNGDRKAQAVQYRALLPTLVTDWRKQFGNQTPFYIVQLASFRAPHDQPTNADVWPLLREAQLTTSQKLNAPLVVTIDLGEEKNVHYHNKQEVGSRLLKSVLNHTYGADVEGSGPTLRRVTVGGSAIQLAFDHAKGLSIKGDADRVFAVAGADRNYAWAAAQVEGDTVTLRSPAVAAPLYARFAWSDNPRAALYNAANLPASPFRTNPHDEDANGGGHAAADPLAERADAAFDAWNNAFLVRDKGQTYYCRTLKTLGTESEGSWVFALDIEVAEDAYERTRSPDRRQLVLDLLDSFLAQNGGDWSGNTWNDDMAWMTTALLRGYQLTGKPAYLDKARHAWNMAFDRGWDTHYGGGGVWENMDNFVHGQGKADKLALSNTSMVRPGLLLYKITGDAAYLIKCRGMYAWIRNNVFDPKTGQVNEGIKWFIGKPDSGWLEKSNNVYNSGTFVEAANGLHCVTGDQGYYDDAVLAIRHVVQNPVIADRGRYQTQWQYRFLKGLNEFATDNGLWSTYRSWMVQNAEAAWSKRDSHDLTWNDWLTATDDPKINALETSSAVAIWQLLPPLERPELSGNFLIRKAGSQLVLAVVSGKAGAPVLLQWSGDTTFPLWALRPTGGGFYRIENVKSGLAMAVEGASVQAGARVIQQPTQPIISGSDQWWVVRNADGTDSFYNHNSNQAMDVAGAEVSAGTRLTQSFANDAASQRFTLVAKR
jgi:sialate O-acetylesterase